MKRFAMVTFGVIACIALAIGLGLLLPQREATSIYDFIILYSANLGVLNRVPIYDNAAILHLVISRLSLSGDFNLFPYPYPPWLPLSTFYLGFLPVNKAVNAWMLLNISMLLGSVLLLSSDWKPIQRIFLSVAALFFLPALGLIVVGQYTAPVLLGAALFVYAARRQESALIALGLLLMTFKPHVGLLLLLAGLVWLAFQKTAYARRAIWLTLAGATLLSLLGFIADPAWPLTYLHSLLSYGSLPGVAGRDLSASLSVILVKLLTGQTNVFWSNCLSALIILGIALLFWRFKVLAGVETLVAGMTLLTLLGSPYLFNYDYVLVLLPLIYLAGHARSPAGRLLLVGCYLLPWISLVFSREANILYACLAIPLVIMLVASSVERHIDELPATHYT